VQNIAIRTGNDHIDRTFDGHEPVDELSKDRRVFSDEASKPEVLIAHRVGQKDRSDLLQVLGHRLASRFDEVPAQRRTGEDKNKAEKGDELCA
jgi:hypothetical protein